MDSCLSLFMGISGGLDWGHFTYPLIAIHWANGVACAIFVFFITFAMLNIVQGVFVDCALKAAHSDEAEIVQDLLHDEDSRLHKIRMLFERANEDGDDYLTFDELEKHLANPEVRTLFKSIGVPIQQVNGLFGLLDLDSSGAVTLEEFIAGCMRLREGASSVDLFTLMSESKRMVQKWQAFTVDAESQFRSLHDNISRLSRQVSCLQTMR
mmetsp:Transcript_62993/g.111922  ORF Transcript_62993/g.111922 Transcript_62993/m.111922 type:complete len:210 (+) Transcript_62993:2-631(+)